MNTLPKLNNVVIMFHDIHSVEWFRSTIDTLDRLYRMISAEELEDFYHNGKRLRNCCHITFDDGHSTFYKNAFPVLKEKNIPASIFVSPKIIRERKNFWFQDLKRVNEAQFKKEIADHLNLDSTALDPLALSTIFKCLTVSEMNSLIDRYFERHQIGRPKGENMTLDQLREIHQSGLIAIGAHTMDHPILKNETEKQSTYEIKTSIEELSEMLGEKVRYFAYPNGDPSMDFSEREMRILQEQGIRLCYSTEKKGFSQDDHFLAIPRNGLDEGSKNLLVVKLLMGKRWYQLKNRIKGSNEVLERRTLTGRMAR